MLTLTSDQYQMITFYYHLLDTIEEGFDYVNEGFANLANTESERVFSDIIVAFNRIDSSNPTIIACLKEELNLSDEVNKFDIVINELEGLEQYFTDSEKKHHYIKNQLTPAFVAWKESVQKKLQPYITN